MYNHTLQEETLLKYANDALTCPSDFGYYGDLPLFESWGFTISQTRDSDVLTRSNYRTALALLQGRAVQDDGDRAEDANDYVQEVHVGHWAHGHADHIAVRVLENESGDVVGSNLTHTFREAVRIALSIEDYPILDESDMSELEMEEQDDAWDAYILSDLRRSLSSNYGIDIDEHEVTEDAMRDAFYEVVEFDLNIEVCNFDRGVEVVARLFQTENA